MAKCPYCEKTGFSVQKIDPSGLMHNVSVLVCSSCRKIVGTLGFTIQANRIDFISATIEKIARHLKLIR